MHCKILRYHSLGPLTTEQYLNWLGSGKVVDPWQPMAVISDAEGQPVLFAPLESTILLGQIVVNPHAPEASETTALLNREVARMAQAVGASKALMEVPRNAGRLAGEYRIIEREIPTTAPKHFAEQHGPLVTRYIN